MDRSMNVVTASHLAQVCMTAGMSDTETARFLHDHGYRPAEPIVARERSSGGMSRRSFLQSAGIAAAAAAVVMPIDPERLLWTPQDRKLVDLGAQEVTIATNTEIWQQEAARLLSKAPQAAHAGIIAARDGMMARRHQRLDVMVGGKMATAHYENGRLITRLSDEEKRIINSPMPNRGTYPGKMDFNLPPVPGSHTRNGRK